MGYPSYSVQSLLLPFTFFLAAGFCYGQLMPPAIEVAVVTSSYGLWNDRNTGGRHNIHFWRPKAPRGFHILGDYAQRNYNAFSARRATVAVKDLSGDALKHPIRFEKVWDDRGSGANLDGSIWRPVPPPGYKAMGLMSMVGYYPPRLDQVVCVKDKYVFSAKPSIWLWDDNGKGDRRCTVTEFASTQPWAFMINTFRAYGYYGYPGHQTAEMNVLNRRYLKLSYVDRPIMPSVTKLQFPKKVNQINFDENGHPLDYHSAFGQRAEHAQDIIRLEDKNGDSYYMGTYSQDTSNNEGGLVFVARRSATFGNKVIWHDEFNNYHPAGGINHPGDIRRFGNIVVIAGQNWHKTYPFYGHVVDPGNGGQAVLFYDVSNPARPKYIGRLSEFFINRGAEWHQLNTEIDEISVNRGPNGMYHLNFNGVKGVPGVEVRAAYLSPHAAWERRGTYGQGSTSAVKIRNRHYFASVRNYNRQLHFKPFLHNKIERDVDIPSDTFGGGTTTSVSVLKSGAMSIVRLNVNQGSHVEIKEVMSE